MQECLGIYHLHLLFHLYLYLLYLEHIQGSYHLHHHHHNIFLDLTKRPYHHKLNFHTNLYDYPNLQ